SAFIRRRIRKREQCSLKSLRSRPDFYWRVFFYSYQTIKSIRHLIASYSMITEKINYFYYDILLAGLLREKLYDSINAALAAPLSLVEMAVDHIIEDQMEEMFLHFIYDLIVLNGRRFFALNPELRPRTRDPRELVKSFRQLLEVNKAKFHRRRLKHYGSISCRTRVRII